MNKSSGFADSGKNLFRGIWTGISGVVTKPLEGLREEGVEGLFKGIGKGAIGVFVHPATGIIDFTSGSCYAMSGNLQKISRYIFVITPRSVDISGDFQDLLGGGSVDMLDGRK